MPSMKVEKSKDEPEIIRIANRATNVAKTIAIVVSKTQDVVNLAKGCAEPIETTDKPTQVGAYGEIEDALDAIRESGAVIEACIARL